MAHPRRLLLLSAFALLAVPAGATAATPLLRLDGIGPLKLGMKLSTALNTKWLAHRSQGCELASPRPVVYQLNGSKAPRGVKGSAQFQGGRLRNLSFTRGVHTATGIVPGVSRTGQMVDRYGRAGFNASADYSNVFRSTFVNVKKGGKFKIMGLAEHERINTLSIPVVPVCE